MDRLDSGERRMHSLPHLLQGPPTPGKDGSLGNVPPATHPPLALGWVSSLSVQQREWKAHGLGALAVSALLTHLA